MNISLKCALRDMMIGALILAEIVKFINSLNCCMFGSEFHHMQYFYVTGYFSLNNIDDMLYLLSRSIEYQPRILIVCKGAEECPTT